MTPAHGGQLRRIAAQYGLRAEAILDFSASINPDGPPAAVPARLRAALDTPATLTCYPDLELYDLRRTLASHLGVAPGCLVIANGFVPLLAAATQARGLRRCLLPVPCFGEYRRTLEGLGCEIVAYPLQEKGFRYDPDDLIRALRLGAADSILLANPQNPSGRLAGRAEMERLVAEAASLGATVLLDEAFIDYRPEDSLTGLALERDGLVVFRSLTKFFAMPGLRVAYCVSQEASARAIEAKLAPWPVSTLAALGAEAALGESVYMTQARDRNERRRRELEGSLAGLGIRFEAGTANFLLLELPVSAETVRERLLIQHGILLRSCANFDGLRGEYLRVAVRTEAENARLVEALGVVLQSLRQV